ncbi:hypothetical protein TNCV_317321 [Trichonephila clavipes]|nr:hypothetical protein TNCV_317321 [Trichonephila clavipes]
MAELNPDALNKLRVIDLKEHLSSRGLSTSGLKADLVKRLREAVLNSEAEDEKLGRKGKTVETGESKMGKRNLLKDSGFLAA